MTTSTTVPMAGRSQSRHESHVGTARRTATRSVKRGERSSLWHLIADECAELGVRFR